MLGRGFARGLVWGGLGGVAALAALSLLTPVPQDRARHVLPPELPQPHATARIDPPLPHALPVADPPPGIATDLPVPVVAVQVVRWPQSGSAAGGDRAVSLSFGQVSAPRPLPAVGLPWLGTAATPDTRALRRDPQPGAINTGSHPDTRWTGHPPGRAGSTGADDALVEPPVTPGIPRPSPILAPADVEGTRARVVADPGLPAAFVSPDFGPGMEGALPVLPGLPQDAATTLPRIDRARPVPAAPAPAPDLDLARQPVVPSMPAPAAQPTPDPAEQRDLTTRAHDPVRPTQALPGAGALSPGALLQAQRPVATGPAPLPGAPHVLAQAIIAPGVEPPPVLAPMPSLPRPHTAVPGLRSPRGPGPAPTPPQTGVAPTPFDGHDIATIPEAAPQDDRVGRELPQVGFSPVPGVRTDRLPRIEPPSAGDPRSPGGATAPVLPDTGNADALPEASAIDLPALRRHAAPHDGAVDVPRMAVVIVDDGIDPAVRNDLALLPFPVTIALDPTLDDASDVAAAWRAAGRELAILARALPSRARPSDLEVTFDSYFATIPEAIGLIDLPESGFQNNRTLAQLIVPILARDGHGLISFDRGLNAADQVARASGLAATQVYRVLDGRDESVFTMRRYLDRALFEAAQTGQVVVLGHGSNPVTLEALQSWRMEGGAVDAALVPVSALMSAE